jgi:TrmH family RNA methyltransferase
MPRYRRLLFCDRIRDPGNMGTLIRAAAGLGVEAVLTHPQAVELTNPKTVRASAGAIFRLPVYGGVPAGEVAAWCNRSKLPILIADAHRGRVLRSVRERRGWLLIVGGETLPLDPAWEEVPAQRIRLALDRGVESLNAAVAGSILIDRLCRGVVT